MKAVFLDVDGVLNDGQNKGEINEENVKRLKEVCNEFDAEVVLYGDYKYMFNSDMTPKNQEAEEIVEALEAQGIKINKTPNLITKEDVRKKMVGFKRPDEIYAFLAKNRVTKFSILGNKKLLDKTIAQNQLILEDGLSDKDIESIKKIMA